MTDISQKSIEKQTRLEKGDAQSALTPYQQKQLKLSQATASKTGDFTGDDILRLLGDRDRLNQEIRSDLSTAAQIGGNRMQQLPAALGAVLTARPTSTREPTNAGDFGNYGTSPQAEPVVNIEERGYTPTEERERPVLDQLNAFFKGSIAADELDIKALQEEYSAPARLDQQNVQEASQARTEAQKGKDLTVGDHFDNFMSAIGDYVDNPLAIESAVVENAPDLLVSAAGGGLVASLSRKGLTKKLVSEMSEETFKNTAKNLTGRELTEKQANVIRDVFLRDTNKNIAMNMGNVSKDAASNAALFGSLSTGAQEGSSNSIQAYNDVMQTKHVDLMKTSAPYRKLLKTHSPDEAREILAQESMGEVFFGTGAAAMAIGKVTGASDAVSKSLVRETGLKGAAKTVAGKAFKGGKDVTREGIEETFQSGVGQAITNVSLQGTVDKDIDTMEGVTDAAAAGLVSGGVLGGLPPALKAITQGSTFAAVEGTKQAGKGALKAAAGISFKRASEDAQGSIKEADATLAEMESQIQKMDESTDLVEATKISKLYSDNIGKISAKIEELQLNKLGLKESLADASPQEAKEIKKQIKQVDKDLIAIQTNYSNLATRSNAARTKLEEKLRAELSNVEDVVSAITTEESLAPEVEPEAPQEEISAEVVDTTPESTEEVTDAENVPEVPAVSPKFQKAVEMLEEHLRLNPNAISDTQAEAILASPMADQLPPMVKRILASNAETRRQFKAATTEGVKEQVIEGGKGHTGLKEYRNGIYQSLMKEGNWTDTKKLMDNLHQWTVHSEKRVTLLKKALAGDTKAREKLTKLYDVDSKVRLSAAVVDEAISEHNLRKDTYIALHKLVTEALPPAKDALGPIDFGSITKVAEPKPEPAKTESTTDQGKKGPRPHQTDYTQKSNGFIQALPEGFAKPVLYAINRSVKADINGEPRTVHSKDLKLLLKAIQFNGLQGASLEDIRDRWNGRYGEAATDETRNSSMNYFKQLDMLERENPTGEFDDSKLASTPLEEDTSDVTGLVQAANNKSNKQVTRVVSYNEKGESLFTKKPKASQNAINKARYQQIKSKGKFYLVDTKENKIISESGEAISLATAAGLITGKAPVDSKPSNKQNQTTPTPVEEDAPVTDLTQEELESAIAKRDKLETRRGIKAFYNKFGISLAKLGKKVTVKMYETAPYILVSMNGAHYLIDTVGKAVLAQATNAPTLDQVKSLVQGSKKPTPKVNKNQAKPTNKTEPVVLGDIHPENVSAFVEAGFNKENREVAVQGWYTEKGNSLFANNNKPSPEEQRNAPIVLIKRTEQGSKMFYLVDTVNNKVIAQSPDKPDMKQVKDVIQNPPAKAEEPKIDKNTKFYHGTLGSFTKFVSSKSANGLLFFTPDRKIAEKYASLESSGYSTGGHAEMLNSLALVTEQESFKGVFKDGALKKNTSKKMVLEVLYTADIGETLTLAEKLESDEITTKDAIAEFNGLRGDIAKGGHVKEISLNFNNPYGSEENPMPWKEAENKGGDWFKKQGYDAVFVTEQGGVAVAVFDAEQVTITNPTLEPESTPSYKGKLGEVIPGSKTVKVYHGGIAPFNKDTPPPQGGATDSHLGSFFTTSLRNAVYYGVLKRYPDLADIFEAQNEVINEVMKDPQNNKHGIVITEATLEVNDPYVIDSKGKNKDFSEDAAKDKEEALNHTSIIENKNVIDGASESDIYIVPDTSVVTLTGVIGESQKGSEESLTTDSANVQVEPEVINIPTDVEGDILATFESDGTTTKIDMDKKGDSEPVIHVTNLVEGTTVSYLVPQGAQVEVSPVGNSGTLFTVKRGNSKAEPDAPNKTEIEEIEDNSEDDWTDPDAAVAPEVEDSILKDKLVDNSGNTGEVFFESNATKRSNLLKTMNMIASFFNFAKENPLNTISNFFDTLNTDNIQQYLPDNFFSYEDANGKSKTTWGEDQSAAANAFIGFLHTLRNFKPSIESKLSSLNSPNYKFYAKDFLLADGTLDQNVYDAMVHSLYKWIATEGYSSLFTPDSDIKRSLGLDSNEALPRAAYVLRSAGIRRDSLEATLGKHVVGILGISAAGKADRAAKARLEMAMGKVVLRLGIDAGIIQNKVSIPRSDLAAWRNEPDAENLQGSVEYFKILSDKDNKYEVETKLNLLIDLEKNSGNVITSLLNESSPVKQVYFSANDAVNALSRKMKGTNQILPKKLFDIVKLHSRRKHVLKKDTYEIYRNLPRQMRLEIYGYQDTEGMPFHMKENVEAANQNIIRELRKLDDFVAELEGRGHGLDTHFYFPHEVWRNMRLGMKSNEVNIQASKLHRHMMGLKKENMTLSLTNTGSKRKRKDFLLSVALGFGISVDKKEESTALNELAEITRDPVVNDSILAMQAIQADSKNNTEANQKAILAGVKKLGEKAHSYEALVQYAKYLKAVETNATKVDVSLIGETDGVTNGPALGLFLMGGLGNQVEGLKTLLNAAGFKFKSMNLPRSHGAWKSMPGSLDLYENSGTMLLESFNASNLSQDYKRALALFIGAWDLGKDELSMEVKAFREPVKEPTVGSSYGQGAKSVGVYAGNFGVSSLLNKIYADGSNNMEYNKYYLKELGKGYFEADIADMKQRIAENKEKGKNVSSMQRRLEYLESNSKVFAEKVEKLTYEEFTEQGLPNDILKTVAEAYTSTVGAMLNEAIETNFAGLKEATKSIGIVSTTLFHNYKVKLDEAIKVKKESLAEKGDGSFDPAYDDLTRSQYLEVLESVKDYLPTIPSFFSKNDKKHGIAVGKTLLRNTEDAKGNASSAHKVEGGKDFGTSFVKERVDVDPGIAAMAAAIHSIDATIMYLVLQDNEVTNIFDAILAGSANLHEASHALNKATIRVLREMDPLKNYTAKFETSLGINAAMLDNMTETEGKRFVASLINLLGEEDGPASIEDLKANSVHYNGLIEDKLRSDAEHNSKIIKELLDDLDYVVQYNKEFAGALAEPNSKGSQMIQSEALDEGKTIQQLEQDLVEALSNPDNFVESVPVTDPVDQGEEITTVELQQRRAQIVITDLYKVLQNLDPESKDSRLVKEMIEALQDSDQGYGVFLELLNKAPKTFKKSILTHVRTLSPNGALTSLVPDDEVTADSGERANEKKLLEASNGTGILEDKGAVGSFVESLSSNKFKRTLDLLTKFIMPLVPDDISINLATRENEKEILGKVGIGYGSLLNGVKGMFVPVLNQVYLQGNHNVPRMRGTSIETIAHELLHSALLQFDSSKIEDIKDPALKDKFEILYNDLEALLNRLRNDPSTNRSEFGNALLDVDELLAWGLTNLDFQKALKAKANKGYMHRFKGALRRFFGIEGRYTNEFDVLLDLAEGVFEANSELSRQTINGSKIKFQAASEQSREEYITSLNGRDIFKSLGVYNSVTDKEHENYLGELLGTLLGSVVDPIRMIYQKNNVAHMGATLSDRIVLSTQDFNASLPTRGLGSYGFKMTPQELYVNQLLNTLLNNAFLDSSRIGKRARNLFDLAKGAVSPEDLRTAPSETKAELQKKWDSIFTVTQNAEGDIHHIREFLALARTNAQLRKVLEKIDTPRTFQIAEGNTLLQKVINFVQEMTLRLFSKWDKLPRGGSALNQLDTLVSQITHVEDMGRFRISNMPEKALSSASKGLENVALKTSQILDMFINKDSRVGKVKNTVSKFFTSDGANLGYGALFITKLLMGKGQLGFAGMALNEIMGEVDAESPLRNDNFHRMLRQFKAAIDTIGQDKKNTVIAELNRAFGKRLTVEESAAITNTVVRSDLVSLVRAGISPQDIVYMIESQHELDSQIKSYENLLKAYVINPRTLNYYLNGAEAMGVAMITGRDTQPNTVYNAERLMDMDGMPDAVPEGSEKVLEILDVLGSLHALNTTQAAERTLASRALVQQINRPTVDNGFTYLMALQESLQLGAKAEQFKDNPKDFIKGFTPDTVDAHKEQAVSNTKHDKNLLSQGFKYIGKLPKDELDKLSDERHLYIHPDAGLNKYVQGIAYINDRKSKGESQFRDRINQGIGIDALIAAREFEEMSSQKTRELKSMYRRNKDLAKRKRIYLRPSFDSEGNISDYRYTLTSEMKDQLLNRNNDMATVMGNMANINHVAPRTKDANRKLLDMLKQQLEIDTKNNNLKGYIRLGNSAPTKSLREAYRLLPADARTYAREIFGTDEIPIRNDLYDVVMGSRKWSIKELWKQDPNEQKPIQELVTKIIDAFTLNQGRWLLPKVEQGVMEVVAKAKNIVVNLSGSVLLANTTSNTNYLVSRGLTFSDSVEWQAEGIAAAKDYLKLQAEKTTLELRITGKYLPHKHAQYVKRIREINVLQSSNTLVKQMIDEGLLSTIAEELDHSTETGSSYGARLSSYIDGKIGVNSMTRDALHNLAITQDTEIYKTLSGLTQFSDFGSRYALIKYTTSRKESPLKMNAAFSDAMRAFVNYDLPTHKALQYLGDIGLLWFPRYMMRIQRTIIHGFATESARTILLTAITIVTGGLLPTIYGSLWGLSNPMDAIGFLDRLFSGLGLHPVLRPF